MFGGSSSLKSLDGPRGTWRGPCLRYCARSRLASAEGSLSACDERACANAKHLGELEHNSKRGALEAALDLAHVDAIDASLERELFLRDLGSRALLAKRPSKGDLNRFAAIPRGHAGRFRP